MAALAAIPEHAKALSLTAATSIAPALVCGGLLLIEDPDGQDPDVLVVTKGEHGEGWIDTDWPNPFTRKIDRKTASVIRTNDVVCGVGCRRG